VKKKLAQRELTVSATPPCALARQFQRVRPVHLASDASTVAESHHPLAVVAAQARALFDQGKSSVAITGNAYPAVEEQPRLESA
jgi:hypothetical protein